MKKINISNVGALQLFQLIRYGAFLLIGVLLAKSDIGQTSIGNYETFLLLAGALTFFWVNGFLKVMMPMSAEVKDDQKKKLVFNAFLLMLFFSVLAAVMILFLHGSFSQTLLNGNKVPLPALLALYVLLNSPAMMTEYIFLINKRSKSIVVYGTAIFSLQILAVGLPPYLGFGLHTILYSLTAVALIKSAYLMIVLKRYSTPGFDRAILKEYIKYGYPLVLSTLLSSSAKYIDGFIITSRFSPDDLAIFQYGARELPLALLLSNSLSMAMLSKLGRKEMASPLAEFRSEVYRLHWLLFPVSALLLLLSHWFYPLIFSEAFSASASVFNVYLLLVVSRVLFPQTILMAKKMNGIIVRASLFEIMINVGMSLFLATKMGIVGVAYATFIAYLFEKIYLSLACRRTLGIRIAAYLPLKLYLLFSFVLVIVFIFVEFIAY